MALFTYFTWPYLHTKKTPCFIDLFIDLLCIQLDLIQGTLLYTICLFILSCLHSFIHPLASLDQVTEPSKMISQPEQ